MQNNKIYMIAVQTVNRLVVAGSLSAGGDRAGGPRGWRRRRRAARERARKKASGRRARGSAARLSRGRRPPGARRNRPPAAAPAPHPSPPDTFFQFAIDGFSGSMPYLGDGASSEGESNASQRAPDTHRSRDSPGYCLSRNVGRSVYHKNKISPVVEAERKCFMTRLLCTIA